MTKSLNSILFWPGIRWSETDLRNLFGALRTAKFTINRAEVTYDSGAPPQDAGSGVQKWIGDARHEVPKWWIGLSLGASVAHIAACTVPDRFKPNRLTLINPFANREELSKEAGFDMKEQWQINPIEFNCPSGIHVDLVISRFDNRISPEHSRRLRACFSGADVKTIELDADHRISDEEQQHLLAESLLTR